MSAKFQVNRWTLTLTSETPNFGRYQLRHDDSEILFDAYEIDQLMAIVQLAAQAVVVGSKP